MILVSTLLTWTETSAGWDSADFHIEYGGPFRWYLMPRAEPEPLDRVRIPVAPLATTTTLSACKREAEQIAVAETRAELRRRHGGLVIAAITGTLLCSGLDYPWNLLTGFALVLAAVRSLGVIVGSSVGHYLAHPHDIFYQ